MSSAPYHFRARSKLIGTGSSRNQERPPQTSRGSEGGAIRPRSFDASTTGFVPDPILSSSASLSPTSADRRMGGRSAGHGRPQLRELTSE